MAGTSPIIRRSLFVVVALLAFAGCSSSGGEDTASTTTADTATTEATGGPETTEAPDDPEPTETTEAPDDTEPTEGGDVCEGLQAISDYDQESSELINGGAEWSEVQAYFVDTTPEVLAAYDDAIAADSEVTEALQTLRDFTEGTGDVAAASSDITDFGTRLSSAPGIMEAGAAGEELNTFAEETCGFSTSAAGASN